jgi:tetratricopeptide (TPR) repeat protein
MESQDNHDLIDNFLTGRLTPAEKEAFEASLKTNEMLRQETETQARLKGIVVSYGAAQLKKRLQKIEAETIHKKDAPKNPYWWLYLIIGLIMAGLAWWVLQSDSSSAESPDAIYAAYYEPFTPVGLSTRDNTTESPSTTILNAYLQKDYSAVITQIQQQPEVLEENIQFQLIHAIALLETNQSKEAIRELENIALKKDPYFTDEAHWYQALALLKSGNKTTAIPLFTSVAENETSEYQQQAKTLLDQLGE